MLSSDEEREYSAAEVWSSTGRFVCLGLLLVLVLVLVLVLLVLVLVLVLGFGDKREVRREGKVVGNNNRAVSEC